jgi:putative MATE family efflux protein
MQSVVLRTRFLFNLCKSALLGKEKNFTSGSVSKVAFILSLPAMLELLIESLLVVVDLLYVSRLGNHAITLAGLIGSVILIIYSVPVGLNIAATSLVARRVGEQNYREAGITAVQAIYIGIVVSVFFSITAFLFNREILHTLGASDQLIKEGDLYSKIRFGCILFLTGRVLINGIFRGAGDTAMAMRTLLLVFIANAAGGGILIFGMGPIPAYGLTGAALANGLGNILAVSYQCWYMRKQKIFSGFGKEQFLPVVAILQKIVKLAFSGTLQYLIPASSWLLMIIIVSQLGTDALTGYIIADRIIICTTLPAWGIANAAGVLTAQNLGAGQPARAEKSVWRTGIFNMCFLGLIALVLLFFTEYIIKQFTANQGVLQNAVLYLRCMAIAFFFFGYTMVISRALNASGYVKVVTGLYIFMFYIIQLPLAWLLGIQCNLGSGGIFTAILVSEVVLAITCIIIFRKGLWKKVHI